MSKKLINIATSNKNILKICINSRELQRAKSL